MSQFVMYRCDVCLITSDQVDNYQQVQFPTSNATDYAPVWHVCADGTGCYLELWQKRKEVTKRKASDFSFWPWTSLASITTEDEDEEEEAEVPA